MEMPSTLIVNIGELISLAPLAQEKRSYHVQESDLGRLKQAWLFIVKGKIKAFGQDVSQLALLQKQTQRMIDAQGQLLIPGLVDSHTHPIFAGHRHDEFVMRLAGQSYQDIAAKGGGIQSTVQATRKASDQELFDLTQTRLLNFLHKGVTSIEVKTGYGLSVQEELRHLRILKKLKASLSCHLSITALPLHAIPLEQKKDAYISTIIKDFLPVVAREKLADFVDAFVETGYFSVEDVKAYVEQAQKLGLGVRLHADEFSDAKGALAAGDWSIASADHLQFASPEGIQRMGSRHVTATLLPGTSLYSRIPFTDARPFAQQACPIAVASDFNPGSCVLDNLHFLTTMAAIHCHLNLAQALVAVTYAPACSLGLGQQKGALAEGFDADLLLYPMSSIEEWLADAGRTVASQIMIQGEFLHSKNV